MNSNDYTTFFEEELSTSYDCITCYNTTEYPSTDYASTDYGTTDYGTTDYGTTDYGTTDYGTTDYGTTDYGTTDYGSTDYGSTDYGSTDYGSTDYPGSSSSSSAPNKCPWCRTTTCGPCPNGNPECKSKCLCICCKVCGIQCTCFTKKEKSKTYDPPGTPLNPDTTQGGGGGGTVRVLLCGQCGLPIGKCNHLKESLTQPPLNKDSLGLLPAECYPPYNDPGKPPVPIGSEEDPNNSNDVETACTNVDTYSGSGKTGGDSVDFHLYFGRFPNWSGFPSGQVELYATGLVPDLVDGSLLKYNHISQRRIAVKVPSDSSDGNQIGILTERGYLRYFSFSNSPEGTAFGGSHIYRSRLRMVNSDASGYTGTIETAPFFEEILPNETLIRYSGSTGLIEFIVTPEKVKISRSQLESELLILRVNSQGDFVENTRISDRFLCANGFHDDRIRQIWNRADGLLNMPAEDIIEWYSPSDVIQELDDNGLLKVRPSAEPLKSWSIRPCGYGLEGEQLHEMNIMETSPALSTESRWKSFGNDGTLYIKGNGSEAACLLKIREPLPPTSLGHYRPNGTNMEAGGVTTDRYSETKYIFSGSQTLDLAGSLDNVDIETATRKVYQSYEFGDVLVTRSENYDMPGEKTWQYIYGLDNQSPDYGKHIRTVEPDGRETTLSYDSAGNMIGERAPLDDNQFRERRYTYALDEQGIRRKTSESEVHISPAYGEIIISQTDYLYETTSDTRKETITSTAIGSPHSRTSIREWYTSHPCSYAVGRLRMEKNIQGVETWYHYLNLSAQGEPELWMIVSTECIDGHIIHGQSKRTVEYINSRGDLVGVDELVHDGTEFVSISSQIMQYDEGHHLIRTLYSDGSEEQAEWSCTSPLWKSDRHGIRTQYTYDEARRLVREQRDSIYPISAYGSQRWPSKDPELVTDYEYDARGNVISTTVYREGRVLRTFTSYDSMGRVTASTDELGRVTRYQYSSDGLTTTRILPAGATLITTIGQDGSVISQTGTGQAHVYYSHLVTRQGLHTSTSLHSPSGPLVEGRIRDGFGQIIRETRTDANMCSFYETEFTYNAAGQLTRKTDSDSLSIFMEYDAFGNLARTTLEQNPAARPDLVTEEFRRYISGGFDVPGLSASLNPDNVFLERTTLAYDHEDNVSMTRSYRMVSDNTRGLGNVSFSQDKFGSWTYEYSTNEEGNIRTFRKSAGTAAPLESISIGERLFMETTPSGGIIRHFGVYSPSGETKTVYYDDERYDSVDYDLAGRVTRVSRQGRITDTYAYDYATGELSCHTNAQGQTTRYLYDSRGRKTAQYGTAVQPVRWEYDDRDRMISMRTWRESAVTHNELPESGGDTTSWIYHPVMGHLLQKQFPDGSTTSYQVDYKGRVIKETYANGKSISIEYADYTGQVRSKTLSHNGGAFHFSYDGSGRLMQITSPQGDTTFGYDSMGQNIIRELVTEDYTQRMEYHFDYIGRPVGYSLFIDDQLVQSVETTHDDYNRIGAAILDDSEIFTYRYDSLFGQPEELSYPNGINKCLNYGSDYFSLTELSYRTSLGEILYQEQLNRDGLDRITQRVDTVLQSHITQRFGYNDRGELTLAELHTCSPEDINTGNSTSSQAGAAFWQYDNIGNRVEAVTDRYEPGVSYPIRSTEQYSPDSANAYSGLYSYDRNGNQTSALTPAGSYNITYNAENRPVTFQGQIKGRTCSIEMKYDYMGRRVEKTTSATDGTVIDRRFYLYDEYLLIAELGKNADGEESSLLARYMWDPSEQRGTRPLCVTFEESGSGASSVINNYPLGQYRQEVTEPAPWANSTPPAGRYYYIHDHGKNVRALTNQVGDPVAFYDYTPYGQLSLISDSPVSHINPFRYSSEYSDKELGLIYFNYRHYNPFNGRWLSRDPIAEEGGNNLFNYVGNAPVMKFDILGLDDDKCGNTYLRFKKKRRCCNEIISCDNLKKGTTYNLYQFKDIGLINTKARWILIPPGGSYSPNERYSFRALWTNNPDVEQENLSEEDLESLEKCYYLCKKELITVQLYQTITPGAEEKESFPTNGTTFAMFPLARFKEEIYEPHMRLFGSKRKEEPTNSITINHNAFSTRVVIKICDEKLTRIYHQNK